MSISEQIKELEEEIRRTPYNKATEHHIGRLKAKLAKLRDDAEKQKSRKSTSISIKKEGDATVAIVGFPSVGKSTLLNSLTGAKSDTGVYNFTTLKPVPGMLHYKGAKIQLIDVPGVIEGASKGRGRGREVISAVRSADLILVMTDIFNIDQVDVIKKELYEAGIRMNEKPADISIKKKERGGIKITSTSPLSIDEQTIIGILREYRIHNADVLIRGEITVDSLIDSIIGNRVYIPAITVVNKIDLNNFDSEEDDIIPVSAEKKINLDVLVEEIYRKLDFIRVYLKPPSKRADMNEPLVMKRGAKVEDVCKKLHRDMLKKFRYARVWGKSVKFNGQRVGLDHVIEDEDILTIYTSG
ncbi:MAG TPA: TGS domain-containing protein [Archaeoglobaceae archaeon]|nr:TGS domain-containing protein [Archaeoglobaceae archaeon]